VSTEVLADGFDENDAPATARSSERGGESVSPPDEYQKNRSPPVDAIRFQKNLYPADAHLQIQMDKLAAFHGYVTATEYPSHQQRYQRIRYLEYRGQSPEENGGGGGDGGGLDQSLIKYEHHQHQQQPAKLDPNSSYVTLESVTDVYQQQQQQQEQQQQNYQQQNTYQTYQPYEGEQPATGDMFNMYEKESHGGGGEYGVKKVGCYGQQQQQQQQQQRTT